MSRAHRYWQCRDPRCPRLACQAYREGFDAGYQAGASDTAAAAAEGS